MLCTLTIDYLCMHEFDENNDNCYVCIRDLFLQQKASNMRLNSSAVGPHAMKHVYSVYIYEDHYRTKLSLFNRCMYGVFVFTEREGLMRRSQLTKVA